MADTLEQTYVPGVCNINPAEIAYRKKARNIGFAVAVILFVILLFTPISPIIRGVLVFFPLFVGLIGYLQAKNHFCVGYGAAGMQNATGSGMTAARVSDDAAVKKDKAKARSMNTQAALISAVVVIATMFIPHL